MHLQFPHIHVHSSLYDGVHIYTHDLQWLSCIMHQCLQLTIDPPKEVRTFLGSFTKSKHQLVEIRIFIVEVRNIFPLPPSLFMALVLWRWSLHFRNRLYLEIWSERQSEQSERTWKSPTIWKWWFPKFKGLYIELLFFIRLMPSYTRAILMNDTLLSVSSFHIEVTYWLLKDSVNLERAFQSCIKKGMVTIVVYFEQTSSKHINKNSWWTCSNI